MRDEAPGRHGMGAVPFAEGVVEEAGQDVLLFTLPRRSKKRCCGARCTTKSAPEISSWVGT
jgi:hypothetical protein